MRRLVPVRRVMVSTSLMVTAIIIVAATVSHIVWSSENMRRQPRGSDDICQPRHLPALQSSAAENEQHDDDDQDHAKDTNPAACAIVRVSVVPPTKAAKQEEQDDNDQD
jgi:hypothetical protein